MHIDEATKRLHATLSGAARQLLEFVETHPALLRDPGLDNIPEWFKAGMYFKVQSMPTLIGGDKLAAMQRAAVELPRLIKRLPELAFAGDRQRFAAYYGFGPEVTEAMLEPPNGVDGALGRGDFIDGPTGLKCLEVNLGNRLGGWQNRCFLRSYLAHPPVAELLAATGIEPIFCDPLQAFFLHAIEEALALPDPAEGEAVVVVVKPAGIDVAPEPVMAELTAELAALARERYGLAGGAFLGAGYEDLELRDDRIWLDGIRVHGVVQFVRGPAAEHVRRAWKAGTVSLYNGPASNFLQDKRNLALLSRLEADGRLDAEDARLVQDLIPWSRELVPSETVREGEVVRIPDVVLAHRERFVIKPAHGLGGVDVHVGAGVGAEEWAQLVERALADGKWLVQDRVESHPFLFQEGDFGVAPYDVVWGLFGFGRHWGGAFTRIAPRGTLGAVNAKQGASYGMVFEVAG